MQRWLDGAVLAAVEVVGFLALVADIHAVRRGVEVAPGEDNH